MCRMSLSPYQKSFTTQSLLVYQQLRDLSWSADQETTHWGNMGDCNMLYYDAS